MRSLMFVINQSPQASPAARERLDQVLMALAFDQEVRVVFVADGVWQLKCGQESGGFAAGYKSLALYGVAAVLVEQESLAERGLQEQDLLMPVDVISRKTITEMMHLQGLLL